MEVLEWVPRWHWLMQGSDFMLGFRDQRMRRQRHWLQALWNMIRMLGANIMNTIMMIVVIIIAKIITAREADL